MNATHLHATHLRTTGPAPGTAMPSTRSHLPPVAPPAG
jgi:hypothetical protein